MDFLDDFFLWLMTRLQTTQLDVNTQRSNNVINWWRNDFYRILRPTETPFVRYSESTTSPIFAINPPLRLEVGYQTRLCMLADSFSRCTLLRMCPCAQLLISAARRKSPKFNDLQNRCPTLVYFSAVVSAKVTLRRVMDFWKVFKASSDSWPLRRFSRLALKVEGNSEFYLKPRFILFLTVQRVHRNKGAALSFRSLAASLSLPLNMNRHPRWQRQAFTGRPPHLHLIFARSVSANGEARRWLPVEGDRPISALSVQEGAGFRREEKRRRGSARQDYIFLNVVTHDIVIQ